VEELKAKYIKSILILNCCLFIHSSLNLKVESLIDFGTCWNAPKSLSIMAVIV